MKKYEIKKAVTLTAQKGSIVILTDRQAELVRDYVALSKKIKSVADDIDGDNQDTKTGDCDPVLPY